MPTQFIKLNLIILMSLFLFGFGGKPKVSKNAVSLQPIHNNEIIIPVDANLILIDQINEKKGHIDAINVVLGDYTGLGQLEKVKEIVNKLKQDQTLGEERFTLLPGLAEAYLKNDQAELAFNLYKETLNNTEKLAIAKAIMNFQIQNDNVDDITFFITEFDTVEAQSELQDIIARSYLKKGDFGATTKWVAKIQTQDIKDKLLTDATETALSLSRPEVAVTFEKGIVAPEHKSKALSLIAIYYAKTGDLHEAMQKAQEVTTLEPQDEALAQIAIEAYKKGEVEKAKLVKDVIDSEAILDSVATQMIMMDIEKGDMSKIDKKMLEESPSLNANVTYNQAKKLISDGKNIEALNLVNSLKEPRYRKVYLPKIATDLGFTKNFEQLFPLFKELESDPLSSIALKDYIKSYSVHGEYREVVNALKAITDPEVQRDAYVEIIRYFVVNDKKSMALSLVNDILNPLTRTLALLELGDETSKKKGVIADLAQAHYLYALESSSSIPEAADKFDVYIPMAEGFHRVKSEKRVDSLTNEILSLYQSLNEDAKTSARKQALFDFLLNIDRKKEAFSLLSDYKTPEEKLALMLMISDVLGPAAPLSEEEQGQLKGIILN